ncbi:MAG: malate synthase [Shewanella psychromarinicola]|jgi:malate synthase|uniref:malate synthase G n=1 Tax=Shewanella psychromarinicola TaxID=2487742 RepID=UPI003ADB57DA
MSQYTNQCGLQVSNALDQLLNNEILPGLDITAQDIWAGFSNLVNDLAPVNKALLKKRDHLQTQINTWHHDNPDGLHQPENYIEFLKSIGYLVEEGDSFLISTENVDAEIAHIAGPQLVVPVNNARFCLNAANARWGSLYDAMYGTNAIADDGGCERGAHFNNKRGGRVIATTAKFLDQAIPLANNISHSDVAHYQISQAGELFTKLSNGQTTILANSDQFIAYNGERDTPQLILLKNNDLHIELHIDPNHPIGKLNPSSVSDVVLESAISTIQDCEDSVAAVDAADKVIVYRNWLGLMKGDLSETFSKGDKVLTRALNPDRQYTTKTGSSLSLHGRSLLLIRNVGHLMTSNAILDASGNEVPEGFIDALFTTLCAMHDFKDDCPLHNSKTKSIYIVKPKMHGPEEVAFSHQLFNRVEDVLGLPRYTMKIGVMDEERRTTANLKECIRSVKERLVFINTGFLDRTGDEIHTSMEAGPMLPKIKIKQQPWISAYEDWNVDIGLECGLPGHAQIGKGMWAKPDEMAQMLEAKSGHPEAGANCAWVPSPTAATLHAMHYHAIDVHQRQSVIATRGRASLKNILTPPMLGGLALNSLEVQQELDNNAQSILGYVVRWIDQGVGCSKVPDINNEGLMEDRATLRISSQLLANWLRHDICSKKQVIETMKRMALVVDEQNIHDSEYNPMAPNFNGIAFESACALVLEGATQPSGYTEPLLHAYRVKAKAAKATL